LGQLEDIKYGDVGAFEEAFHSYYSPLCAHAFGILKDPDDAEEMVQNVFVKFWNKKDHVTIATSFKSYLYQSVKNECLNYIKHRKVVAEHVQETVYLNKDSVTDDVIASELQGRIDAVVQKLPPERKKIFLMNRSEGKKYKEIADELNIAVKTVENQIGKALKFLRVELAEYLSAALLVLAKWINFF